MALDPYYQLGIARDASAADIEMAWKRKRRETHPDHNPNDPHATTRFQLAKEAYEILSDPERRAKYDRGDSPDALSPAQKAMGLLAGVLMEVLKHADKAGVLVDPRFSLIDALRENVERMRNDSRGKRRAAETLASGLKAQLKRFKFKGDGTNVVAEVLQGQLDRAEAMQKKHDADLADWGAALALLAEYEALPAEDLFTTLGMAGARSARYGLLAASSTVA